MGDESLILTNEQMMLQIELKIKRALSLFSQGGDYVPNYEQRRSR